VLPVGTVSRAPTHTIAMLQLDQLSIIARSLAEGIEHVRACRDIDTPDGATHAEGGAELR